MTQLTREQQITALEKDWAENPRWKGITRGYSAADVVRLRGSVQVDHTLAKRGAHDFRSEGERREHPGAIQLHGGNEHREGAGGRVDGEAGDGSVPRLGGRA